MRTRIVAFCGAVLLSAAAASAQIQTENEFLAGADARTIDLPEGIALAGYFERRAWPFETTPYARYFKASEGHLDATRVKSLALKLGERVVILASVDLVLIEDELRDAVIRRLAPLGVDKSNVIIAATHTHSGPGGYSRSFFWQQFAFDRFVSPMFESLVHRVSESIFAAMANMKPAAIAVGQKTLDDFTYNRRNLGQVDPTLTVMKVAGRDRKPIANVVVFPIHGTFLSHENLKLSADLPGTFERAFDENFGGVTLFFQGAGGDAAPKGTHGDADQLREFGDRFFRATRSFYRGLRPTKPATLSMVNSKHSLGRPMVNVRECIISALGMSPIWLYILPARIPVPESLFKPLEQFGFEIDGHAFVTVPGEPIAEIGAAIKQRSSNNNFKTMSTVGLANGYIGYVLSANEYEAGGYETCTSFFGPDLGERIVNYSAGLLNGLESAREQRRPTRE